MLAWLIYGNVLFWSSTNICHYGGTHTSYNLWSLMISTLAFGYLAFLIILLAICCIPILVFKRKKLIAAGTDPKTLTGVSGRLVNMSLVERLAGSK